MQIYSIVSLIVFLFLAIACGKPECKNRNSVFNDYSFASKEYKEELIKQVQLIGIENLSYFIDSYVEKDSRTYLTVNFIGNGLCAKGVLLVKDWNKLKDIQRTRGMSYRGAKLVGLQFDIPNDSSNELVYRDVDYVRD